MYNTIRVSSFISEGKILLVKLIYANDSSHNDKIIGSLSIGSHQMTSLIKGIVMFSDLEAY